MSSECIFDMESDPSSGSDEETSGSFDIFPTLTRQTKKGKGSLVPREDDMDDDTELEEMIRRSITRRDVKAGTEFLKSAKGKKKLTKGEVGGGSFQSMGTFAWPPYEYHTDFHYTVSRAFPLDFARSYTPRFPYTYTYSTTFHPHPPFKSSS